MRIPIKPCPYTPEQESFKKIGDRFMNHKTIKKHINNADEWIDAKFEQVFDVPMTDFRSIKLDPGRLKTFENELKFLTKAIEKDKGIGKAAKFFFTTSAKIRSNPEYAKLYDDFIDIQHSFKGRDITNAQGYQRVIDNMQLEAISRGLYEDSSVRGVKIDRMRFNKAVKKAAKLWEKQQELSTNAWNKVPGADQELKEISREITDYLKTKEGKIFFDFINIVEKDLPKIAGKIEDLRVERNLLREKGEDYSHIRKRYNDKDLLGGLVESQHMRNAVKDYIELMNDNFNHMERGIDAYINGIKAGLDAKGYSHGNIDAIAKGARERLLPDKKVGYYPHYSNELNAEFLNGLMLKFDRISELTADQTKVELKKGQTLEKAIQEALVDTEGYVTSRAKHRKAQPNDYSYLFPVVMQKYTSEVSRFNFMAHTEWKTRESLNLLKKRFKNGEDIDGYATDIVNLIQGMHYDMTGQRTIDNPKFQSFLRTALNLQYVSKIGGNVRTAGKNLSQWLVNWVQFGGQNMKASRKFYENNQEMSALVDKLLKESGLFYEAAPRELEEGGIGRSKVKLSKDFELEFEKPSFWDKTAEATSKIAGSNPMSFMMRKVENFNRKSAFKNQFYQTYTLLNNSKEFYNERLAAGKSDTQIQREIISRARRAAIRITTSLHYDYSHVSKSEAMKTPAGAVVFQFQHFFNEFTRFNAGKIKGLKNDWATKQFLGPQAWQAYRLGMAYSVIPGLLSLMFGANFFNVVEHATADKAKQLFTALTGDDEEIKKAFYGRGTSVAGFVGAPLIGDIVTVGELANLWDLSEEDWASMIFGFREESEMTDDQAGYAKLRIANGQLARFRYRTLPMMTSGHFMMGLQSELGLYPSKDVRDTRENIMDGIGDLSPELQRALMDIYKESERHRKAALR